MDREVVGSPGWARTSDFLINSQALYRLSYRGIVCSIAHLSRSHGGLTRTCYQFATSRSFREGLGASFVWHRLQRSAPWAVRAVIREHRAPGEADCCAQKVAALVPSLASYRTKAHGLWQRRPRAAGFGEALHDLFSVPGGGVPECDPTVETNPVERSGGRVALRPPRIGQVLLRRVRKGARPQEEREHEDD